MVKPMLAIPGNASDNWIFNIVINSHVQHFTLLLCLIECELSDICDWASNSDFDLILAYFDSNTI